MPDTEPGPIPASILDSGLIEAALQRAFREAVLQHRRAGHPMVFWKDGQVVWMDPNEIDLPDPNGR